METERELYRKLVRSTVAEYERANAAGDTEVIAAMHEISRAAYEIETRFEKRQNAATTAMLAIVTADDAEAQKLYLLALQQNRREPDVESYVWRLHLGQRFSRARLVSWKEELWSVELWQRSWEMEMPCSKQMRHWSVCRSNIKLVATRNGEVPLFAAQLGR
jgi:hypothetical protein